MEINILEFVNEYKKDPAEALKKLEVENYVPFTTKKALIDTVIESILEYDTALLTYEPMNKHLNFSLSCVVIYTNLTYGDEEGLDAYDALVSSGLLDKIIEMIGVDYGDMVAMFEETLSARISFTNSISNRFSAFIGVLEKVFENASPEDLNYLRKLADTDGDNTTAKKAD
jgi:hypothetical protein